MATIRNLYVDQGSDFSLPFTVSDGNGSPLNLLGYTTLARLKRTYQSKTWTNLEIEITSASDGSLTLWVLGSVTLGLKPGRYVYDVLLISEEDVPSRALEGIITINPAVTKVTEVDDD